MTKGATITAPAPNGDTVVIAHTRHLDATAAPTTPGEMPAGVEFVWATPGDLLLDANARATVNLDPEFLGSIRDLGVLVPVVAVRTPEGLKVQKGQRRTLAAVEVGRDGMPVYVVPAGDDATRIIEQLAENHDREAMTQADTAAAYEQLALLGLSAAQIAKRTHRTKAQVSAGLTVAKSEAAADAAARHGLDLIDAALFAEFEDDEAATRELTFAAQSGRSLAHAAQQARDRRARAEAMAAVRAALEADGVKVVTAPGYYTPLVRAVGDLRAKGQRDPLTVEQHATCPRHVAWVEYDPETRTAAPVYGCSDYKASGHQQWTDPDAPAATPNVLSEDERAERRQVRENNAAWRSAETVRREWLPTLAARKTPPKGAAEFIARAVAFDGALLQDAATKGHHLAAQMLGHKRSIGGARYIAGLLDKASTPRSQVIALVVVLAAIEQNTGVHTWRHARPEDTAARYLTALEGWGYDLSDIEKQTCGRPTTAPDAA